MKIAIFLKKNEKYTPVPVSDSVLHTHSSTASTEWVAPRPLALTDDLLQVRRVETSVIIVGPDQRSEAGNISLKQCGKLKNIW